MIYYVEVVYLSKSLYQKRKYIQYPTLENAEAVYLSTIAKFKNEKKESLICLRGEQGLIKSELLKFKI